MIAVCAASFACRAPAGNTCRSADLRCARPFSWRVWRPLSERALAAVLLERLAGKKGPHPSWNQYFTSHQRTLGLGLCMLSQLPATPRCWSPARPDHPPTAKDQAEKMPGGVKRRSARQLGVSTNSRSEPKESDHPPNVGNSVQSNCLQRVTRDRVTLSATTQFIDPTKISDGWSKRGRRNGHPPAVTVKN